MHNPSEILKRGGNVGYKFFSYTLSFYEKNYNASGAPDGIKRTSEPEGEKTLLYIMLSSHKFKLLWFVNNALYERIDGNIKNIKLDNSGEITLIEGTSGDLTLNDNVPFWVEFDKQPLLPVEILNSSALISVKGTDMFDPPIVMQWVLNNREYLGEVKMN